MDALSFSLLGTARQWICVPMFAALLLGGTGFSTLRAQTEPLVGDAISVPLTRKTFEEGSPSHNLISNASRGAQGLQEKPSGEIKSEPKLQNPTYYRLPLGGRRFSAILDVGKDAETAQLYIDFDGKGLFEDVKGIEGVDRNKDSTRANPYAYFEFGPITLPKTEAAVAGPVEIMVSCHVIKKEGRGTPYLRFTPHNYVTGKLRLGPSEHAVGFVDGTFTGRFQPFRADPSAHGPAMFQVYTEGASMMAVDLNNNGLIDFRGEVSPLVDMVRIAGKYFHVSVSPDGSQASFQEAKPELGILDTGCPGMELFVVSDKCAAMLTSNADGKWELPLGKYRAEWFMLSRVAGDIKWTLDGSRRSPAMEAIEIKAEAPCVIALGPPLILKYSLDNGRGNPAGTVSIGLNVTGKNGETYSAGAEQNRSQEPEPTFTIQSESGEKLAEGKFEYG